MDTVTLPRAVFDELVAAGKNAAVVLNEVYQATRKTPAGKDAPPFAEPVRRLVSATRRALSVPQPEVRTRGRFAPGVTWSVEIDNRGKFLIVETTEHPYFGRLNTARRRNVARGLTAENARKIVTAMTEPL